MSKVVVKNSDFDNLPEAISGIFEELNIDLKGKSVLIKPNFAASVGPVKSAITDPRVVKAVLDECLKQTDNVVIGENPGNMDTGAMHCIEASGMLELASDYYENISKEAEFVDIGSKIIPNAFLSKKISSVDYVINIPKMKTHVLTGVSCCVKNLFGYVVGAIKSRYHLESKSAKGLTQFFIDLYKYKTPYLNIIDAIYAMEGGGPTHGDTRHVGKIIGCTNGVEGDAVITKMMDWEPRHIHGLVMAHDQGLGEIDIDKIDVVGDFEVLPEFKRPPTFDKIHTEFNPYEEITKITPTIDESKCTVCQLCAEESCPADAIDFEPGYANINTDKCISCYCCVEFCPEAALSVEYQKDFYEIA
ncbi:MAG: DUF362 domain-containing protein [Desulfobacterales bacterium]|jgi:uncharacterized protein (DUF362 family)|nr:DUF362 domain-containing protein [Desulfobacteraceae bacterium]MBT4365370.1 DUF362 domain-containing protein [Desulfobacteraceae bacterium]MBT7084861.1 DUF362 domain-containing protein [Desulfobacterales bacterium]MBT7698260.1 DUF362 domain-containing protein [Desulfobacterales bacterium]